MAEPVLCKICNKLLKMINSSHLKAHGIKYLDYIKEYGENSTGMKGILFRKIPTSFKLCGCGCGKFIEDKRWNTYKLGHHLYINNPMNNLENRKKISLKNKGRIKSKEEIERISKTLTGRKRPEYVTKKISDKLRGRNLPKELVERIHKKQRGQKRSYEFRKRLSMIKTQQILNGTANTYTHGKCGYFISNKMGTTFYYRSSTEKLLMEHCEFNDNIKSYTNKHGIYIQYKNEFDNSIHNYIPDFLINNYLLIETKGFVRLKDWFKWKATRYYCIRNDFKFKVIMDSDIKKENFNLNVGDING